MRNWNTKEFGNYREWNGFHGQFANIPRDNLVYRFVKIIDESYSRDKQAGTHRPPMPWFIPQMFTMAKVEPRWSCFPYSCHTLRLPFVASRRHQTVECGTVWTDKRVFCVAAPWRCNAHLCAVLSRNTSSNLGSGNSSRCIQSSNCLLLYHHLKTGFTLSNILS